MAFVVARKFVYSSKNSIRHFMQMINDYHHLAQGYIKRTLLNSVQTVVGWGSKGTKPDADFVEYIYPATMNTAILCWQRALLAEGIMKSPEGTKNLKGRYPEFGWISTWRCQTSFGAWRSERPRITTSHVLFVPRMVSYRNIAWAVFIPPTV